MLMLATAGLKPCETIGESLTQNYGCRLCENAADGYGATFDSPLCRSCATTFSDFYTNIEEGRHD